MLDEADFRTWCSRLCLTQAAREAIAAIRFGRPARCVGGGRRNVAGRYPSRKMGVTIQFESHRVELPFIYEAEHDSQVLEYYDQPPSIPLVYRAVNGRRLSVMHTPDYFVLRDGSACWIECKTEEDLEALASRNLNRYPDQSFRWCRPAGWVTRPQNGSIKLIGNSATEFPPGIDSPGKAIGGESLEQLESAMFLGCKRFSRNLWNLTNRSQFTTSPLASAIQTTVTFSKSFPICVQPSAKGLRRGNKPTLRNCAEHWKMPSVKIHPPLWLNLVAG